MNKNMRTIIVLDTEKNKSKKREKTVMNALKLFSTVVCTFYNPGHGLIVFT